MAIEYGAATAEIDVEISHSVLIRAPREKVYDAISTAEGLDSWFTTGSTIDLRPGGDYTMRWKDWGPDRVNEEAGGYVVAAEPPSRLVVRWPPGFVSEMTTVEFDLEEDERGTVLRLREHGYPDTTQGRKALVSCSTGWGEALTLLKFYVEHGIRY